MARFFILTSPAGCFGLAAGALGLVASLSTPARAQQPASAPMAPAPTASVPAKAPATNAPPVAPSLPPDTLGRYGKILVPSDQIDHPLKLKMPFPDVGEVQIPNQDSLNVREKLDSLTKLSDTEIRAQLEQWPGYNEMSLRDDGVLLQRIQDFRDYRTKVALQKAHDMGLLTLTPEEKARFEKDYWDKRLQMDRDLAKQFEPVFKAREQKLQDELFREFSSATAGPVASATKPPVVVAPPVNQPAQVTAKTGPVAQNKTTASSASAPALTNTVQPVQPMAQTPR